MVFNAPEERNASRTFMWSLRSESLSLTYSHRHTPDICAKRLEVFSANYEKLLYGDQRCSLAMNCLQRVLKDAIIKAMMTKEEHEDEDNPSEQWGTRSLRLVFVFVHISSEPCKYFPMCNSNFKYYFTSSNVMHSLNAVLLCFQLREEGWETPQRWYFLTRYSTKRTMSSLVGASTIPRRRIQKHLDEPAWAANLSSFILMAWGISCGTCDPLDSICIPHPI